MRGTAERYEVELHCPRCGRLTCHLVAPRAGSRSQVTCVVRGKARSGGSGWSSSVQ